MNVMNYTGYGSPDRLVPGCAPRPLHNASQLLIRVLASSVNPVDWKLHDGQLRWLMPRRFPSVPGLDLMGQVEETGRADSPFSCGDRIISLLPPGRGASAEYCLVDVPGGVVRVPRNMSDLEAAGLPLAGLTAWQGLITLGGVQAGQRVLIVGASGGVGHFAVQIARAKAATVVGVCSGANRDWVKTLGADEVVDYTQNRPWAKERSFDVIFDCVSRLGHAEIQRLLQPEGIYVDTLFKPELMLRGLMQPLHTRQRYKSFLVSSRAEDLSELLALHQAGLLNTHIDSVYDWTQLAEAHRRSQSGRARGKIVIRVAQP